MNSKNSDRNGIKKIEPSDTKTAPPKQPIKTAPDLVLRVGAASSPASVAGAIAGALREHGRAEVQAIGAGAVNVAVKAIAISRGYVAPAGMNLVCTPAFLDIIVNDEERTAIRFVVEPR